MGLVLWRGSIWLFSVDAGWTRWRMCESSGAQDRWVIMWMWTEMGVRPDATPGAVTAQRATARGAAPAQPEPRLDCQTRDSAWRCLAPAAGPSETPRDAPERMTP